MRLLLKIIIFIVLSNSSVMAAFEGEATTAHYLLSEIADDDYLDGHAAMTVCAWVKSDSASSNDKGFINFIVPNGADSAGMRYDSAGAASGCSNCLKLAITATSGSQSCETPSSTQSTNWTHYCMSWTTAVGLNGWVDGAAVAMGGCDPDVTGTTVFDKLYIGKGSKDSASSWDGKIADVAIWSSALSANQIELLYKSKGKRMPLQIDPANLLVYFPLDDFAEGTTSTPVTTIVSDNSLLDSSSTTTISQTLIMEEDADRLLIRPDVSGFSTEVGVAYFRIYEYSRGGQGNLFLTEIRDGRDWVEAQVNFDDYKTSTTWTTAGANSTVSDYLSSPSYSKANQNGAWVEWEVTSWINSYINGTKNNEGWRITGDNGDAVEDRFRNTSYGSFEPHLSTYTTHFRDLANGRIISMVGGTAKAETVLSYQ